MDAEVVRAFVNQHLDGVEIRLIDGTIYRKPHRDYVWSTPAFGQSGRRVGRYATSFGLHDVERDQLRLDQCVGGDGNRCASEQRPRLTRRQGAWR